jgi:hypothetical protein
LLRAAVARALDVMWQQDHQQHSEIDPTAGGGEILKNIQALSPKNDAEHVLQAQALSMAIDLGKLRWLMFEQGSSSISLPLLAMLVFWLAIVFANFGLFAPTNATVTVRVTKREKRACKGCEEQGVQSAPLPARIIDKGAGECGGMVRASIKASALRHMQANAARSTLHE